MTTQLQLIIIIIIIILITIIIIIIIIIIFQKYVHQTCNDRSPLLLTTSPCLSLVFVIKSALRKYVHVYRISTKNEIR